MLRGTQAGAEESEDEQSQRQKGCQLHENDVLRLVQNGPFLAVRKDTLRLVFPAVVDDACILTFPIFTALVTTYNSLVGVARTIPGLGIRDMHWICHRGL